MYLIGAIFLKGCLYVRDILYHEGYILFHEKLNSKHFVVTNESLFV
jgi:hypothetical protein